MRLVPNWSAPGLRGHPGLVAFKHYPPQYRHRLAEALGPCAYTRFDTRIGAAPCGGSGLGLRSMADVHHGFRVFPWLLIVFGFLGRRVGRR